MNKLVENKEQRLFSFIASFVILYMGFAVTFCYEMGKYGIDNIDWGFIFQSNLPVVIIAGSLLLAAFRTKRKLRE